LTFGVVYISQENVGSEFKFSLEFGYQEATISHQQVSTLKEEMFDLASVLVAEDNEINQQLIFDILSMKNIKVTIANNGLEAFEHIKSENFDLIFMDINMPVMGGIEATKNILAYEKKFKQTHTPIVALTANAIVGDKERFLQAGMDDFLSKPFELAALNAILEKYLGSVVKNNFDSEEVASSLGISKDKVHGYLKKFLDMVEKELPNMKRNYQNRDFSSLTATAHKLKGTSGMLKIENITNSLREIEQNAKEQNDFAYEENFQMISQEMKVLEVF